MSDDVYRRIETGGDPNIDDGVCVTCNMEVTYDEASQDDEVCIRTKPYCTKHVDEHVDWRATCKHVEKCLAAVEADLAKHRDLVQQMRPVYEAAVEWRRQLVEVNGYLHDSDDGNADQGLMRPAPRTVLARAIDSALARKDRT